ncbi:MAG: 3-phosphoshikimate 1-carboxyvinyltransferase, partial [Methylococcales bacterium]
MSLNWLASAGQPLNGQITVPGDKSISHRAIMLGAIAEGVTKVTGFLEGEDTRATARIFQQLGVRIETPSPSERIIHG